MRRFAFAGAPADSCGRPGGTECAPDALRDVGMVAALNADHVGDIDACMRGAKRNAQNGLIAMDEVVEATLVLRRRVARLVEDGLLPFVAGGCRAIAPGTVAGARDALSEVGPPGLAYVSGRMDLHDGDTSPTGHAADTALATLLGRGSRVWGAALGDGATVGSENAALVGFGDREEAERAGAVTPKDFQPPLAAHNVDRVRELGVAATGRSVLGRVASASARFWLHVDVGVLDELVFPATDRPMPDGLDWDELSGLLRPLIVSPALVGVSLSGYNPGKDEGSSCGLHLVDMFRALCG